MRPGSWNSRPLRILRFAALFARRRYKSTAAARGAVRRRTGQRHYALLRTAEIRTSTKKSFDSIHIAIRDDLGDKIQFENGKVLVTLHFRRAKELHFI